LPIKYQAFKISPQEAAPLPINKKADMALHNSPVATPIKPSVQPESSVA